MTSANSDFALLVVCAVFGVQQPHQTYLHTITKTNLAWSKDPPLQSTNVLNDYLLFGMVKKKKKRQKRRTQSKPSTNPLCMLTPTTYNRFRRTDEEFCASSIPTPTRLNKHGLLQYSYNPLFSPNLWPRHGRFDLAYPLFSTAPHPDQQDDDTQRRCSTVDGTIQARLEAHFQAELLKERKLKHVCASNEVTHRRLNSQKLHARIPGEQSQLWVRQRR